MAKISNEKILRAVSDITKEIIGEMNSVLLTMRNEDENETVEIACDKDIRIFVHRRGIRVTGANTPNNISHGLEGLSSDKNRAYKVYSLDSGTEVGRVINGMD